ncbi:MAG: GntR family transcriptional regulator [Oscillospiraceae bacterium]|nr:GntR family transcriptional regulator [Oscillospiraceae bacterium]
MKQLKTGSSLPLYKQLSLQLWEDIQFAYPSGSKIPSEAELAATYQVSIMTVHKAVALLAERGLLEIIRGKGCKQSSKVHTFSPANAHFFSASFLAGNGLVVS